MAFVLAVIRPLTAATAAAIPSFLFTEMLSRTSNIESKKSQNGGLEDYNNISDGIFPHFTTLSKILSLGYKEFEDSFKF